MQKSLSIKKN